MCLDIIVISVQFEVHGANIDIILTIKYNFFKFDS